MQRTSEQRAMHHHSFHFFLLLHQQSTILSTPSVRSSKRFAPQPAEMQMNLINDAFVELSCLHLSVFLFIIAIILSWLSTAPKKTRTTVFACQQPEQRLHAEIIGRIRALGEYVPPWWYNQHLFALVPFPNDVSLSFERDVYCHPDGSSFVTDTYPTIPADEAQPRICVLLPGLASTSQDVRLCIRSFDDSILAITTYLYLSY
jgi:hypothetical protein